MNLITFVLNAGALRVMEREGRQAFDIGVAVDVFGADINLIQIGNAHGADDARGAYEWYPLTIRGERVGELRDDASGMTIHVEQRARKDA